MLTVAQVRARFPQQYADWSDDELEAALRARESAGAAPSRWDTLRADFPAYADWSDDELEAATAAKGLADAAGRIAPGRMGVSAPPAPEPPAFSVMAPLAEPPAPTLAEAIGAPGEPRAIDFLRTWFAPDPEAPPGEPSGFAGHARNVFRGIGERATALGAGGLDLIGGLAGALNFRPQPSILESDAAAAAGALRAAGEGLGYVPEDLTWAGVVEDPAGAVLPMMRTFATSAPDMAAAAVSLPAYAGMLAGDIARQRATLQGLDAPGSAEIGIGLAAGIPSAALQRFGAQRLFGPGRAVTGPVSAVREVGRRAGTEAVTEAVQSPIELAGVAAGTPRAPGLREYAESAALGGTTGLVGGAPMAAGATLAHHLAARVAEGERTRERERISDEEYFRRLAGEGEPRRPVPPEPPPGAPPRPVPPEPPPGEPPRPVPPEPPPGAPPRPVPPEPPPGAPPRPVPPEPPPVVPPRPVPPEPPPGAPPRPVPPEPPPGAPPRPVSPADSLRPPRPVQPAPAPAPEPVFPEPAPREPARPVEGQKTIEDTPEAVQGAAQAAGVTAAVPAGEPARVYTPDAQADAPVRYAVVDATRVKASLGGSVHDPGYDPALQPRDRSRVAARIQIGQIAASPNFELMSESRTSDTGAPIVTPAFDVLSGNGRTYGLRKAYADGRAAEYEQAVRAWAARHGIDTAGIARPMLVRVATRPPDGMNWQAFAHASNKAAVLATSRVEQAQADAEGPLTVGVIEALDPDTDVLADKTDRNRAGFSLFLRGLPTAETAGLVSASGEINQQLRDRVVNAVMYYAFRGNWLVQALEGEIDAARVGLLRALRASAVGFAQLRARGQDDVVDDALLAVKALVRWSSMSPKDRPPTLAEFVRQSDVEGERLSERAQELAEALHTHSRSANRLRNILVHYADTFSHVSDPQEGLFGGPEIETDIPSIVGAAEEAMAERAERAAAAAGQGTMFTVSPDGRTLRVARDTRPPKPMPRQPEQTLRYEGNARRRAWHGSGARFNRFRMQSIGSGEGAQAYGHGLYFAESRSVAESYWEDRRSEARGPSTLKAMGAVLDQAGEGLFAGDEALQPVREAFGTVVAGLPTEGLAERIDASMPPTDRASLERWIAGRFPQWVKNGKVPDDFVEYIELEVSALENALRSVLRLPPNAPRHADGRLEGRAVLDALVAAIERVRQGRGDDPTRLYEVSLDVDDPNLLDWDRPLDQQAPDVRAAVEQAWRAHPKNIERDLVVEMNKDTSWAQAREAAFGKMSGQMAYAWLATDVGQERASQLLLDAGLRGIRYANASTRGFDDSRPKVYNYVVFDERYARIVKRYEAVRGLEETRPGRGEGIRHDPDTEEGLFSREPTPRARVEDYATPRPQPARGSIKPGERWIGRAATVEGEPGPAPAPRATLKRREAIIAPLLRALSSPLYTGRMTGFARSTLGFYRPRTGELRIRHHNDAEVVAHEIAHLLDARYWGTEFKRRTPGFPQRPWLAKSAEGREKAAELKAVSYDKEDVTEGFAEFVRLWLTQPQQARERAPKMNAWMHAWTRAMQKDKKASKISRALLKARTELTKWHAAHPAERAASKVGAEPERLLSRLLSRPFADIATEVEQALFDDLRGIDAAMKRAAAAPAGPGETRKTAHDVRMPFLRARTLRGAQGIVENAMLHGYPVAQIENGEHVGTTFEGQGAGAIVSRFRTAREQEDFMLYLVGRSAAELRRQDRENLFDEPEIRAMVALGKGREDFEQAARDMQAWFKGVADFAQALGVISPEARQQWRRTFYFPFYRAMQPGPAARTERPGKAGRTGGEQVVRALRGGTANLAGLMENVTRNAHALITTALTNEVRRDVIDTLMSMPQSARAAVGLSPRAQAVRLSPALAEDAVRQVLGVPPGPVKADEDDVLIDKRIMEAIDAMEGPLVLWRMVNDPVHIPGERILVVMRNGKPKYYEVADPLLFESLSLLRRPARRGFLHYANLGRQLVQRGITIGFDFMSANFVRDMVSGTTYSRVGYRPLVDGAKGLWKIVRKNPVYKDFLASGAGSTRILMEDEVRLRAEAFYKRRGLDTARIVTSPLKLLHLIENVGWALENATRVETFNRARAQGMGQLEAAAEAREISTDYSVRGTAASLNAVRDMATFFSAGVNGLYMGLRRLGGRNLTPAQWRRIAFAVATYNALSIGVYALVKDHPMVAEAEDWERIAFDLIPVPNMAWFDHVQEHGTAPALAGDLDEAERYYNLWRIPRAWELAFPSVAVTMAMQHHDRASKLAAAVAQTFGFGNPFGWFWFAKPFVEQYANKQTFTGRPIVGQGEERLIPQLQATPSTPHVLSAAAEHTEALPGWMQGPWLSPARQDAFGRALAGHLWTQTMIVLDALAPGAPEKHVREWPIARRFLKGKPGRTQAETDLYEMLAETERAAATLAAKQREGRLRPQDRERYGRDAAIWKQIAPQADSLSAMRRLADRIRHSDLPPAEKRERLDQIRRAIRAKAMGMEGAVRKARE